jgi:hypothetical protein
MARVFSDSAFLHGQRRVQMDGYFTNGPEVGALVGAETSASFGDVALRSITISVATGVLTFLINHWLEKMLK